MPIDYRNRRQHYTSVVPRYDVPKAAPEPLAIVQRFVNSTDLENRREWLSTPAELANWLREAGLPVDGPFGESDLTRAHELREALRLLLQANNGRPLSREAVSVFNAAVAAAPLASRPAATAAGRSTTTRATSRRACARCSSAAVARRRATTGAARRRRRPDQPA